MGNKSSSQINTLISNLESVKNGKSTKSLYQDDYLSVRNQNVVLENQIQEIKDNYSIDNRKVAYQTEQIDGFKTWNAYLFLLYYICVVFMMYIIVVRWTMSGYFKGFLIVALILYPLWIDLTEQVLFFLYNYLAAIINANAYTSNNY